MSHYSTWVAVFFGMSIFSSKEHSFFLWSWNRKITNPVSRKKREGLIHLGWIPDADEASFSFWSWWWCSRKCFVPLCLDSVKKKQGNAEKVLSSSSCSALMWLLGQAGLLWTTEGACPADSTALSGAKQLLHRWKTVGMVFGRTVSLSDPHTGMKPPGQGLFFWKNILCLKEILIHWLHVLIKKTQLFE